MKMINNKQYGPSSNKLLNIYKNLILSKLDYGSSIYACVYEWLHQMLEPVQNLCTRLALRTFSTSPIISLQPFTGIFSLTYRRKRLSNNMKFTPSSDFPHTKSSKQSSSQILASHLITSTPPTTQYCPIRTIPYSTLETKSINTL